MNATDSDLRTRFLGGMSHAAATVNIITTDGAAGRAGVTVSAMSSVSADTPRPTLLVCVHQASPAAAAILKNGVFCVNVLRDDQAYISDTFAGRFKDQVEDKFEVAEWKAMPSGAPRVVDPLVAFDCTVVSSDLVGTHHVFFGEVGEIFIAGQGSPLIYANRAYGSPNRIESAATVGAGRAAAGSVLTISCFHTFGPYILPELIQKLVEDRPGQKIALVEGDQRRVQESLLSGESEIGLLYDADLSPELTTTTLTELTPYVLLAEAHPLADLAQLTATDLAGHPLVLFDTQPSLAFLHGLLGTDGARANVAFRSTSFEMVRGLVGHGLGYSILATKPASSMTYDGKAVVARPLVTDTPPTRVLLARRRNWAPSGAAERFMALCRAFFQQGGEEP